MRIVVERIAFLLVCYLQPICIPTPEAITILAGSELLGASWAFALGLIGTLAGICTLYELTRKKGRKFIQKFINMSKIEKYNEFVGRHSIIITGLLFIIPVLPDEIICVGAGLANIKRGIFLTTALFSKIVSISMIAYAEVFAKTFQLSKWEILFIELVILFTFAGLFRFFSKRKSERIQEL